jgi:hypothetical protein
MNCVKSQKHFLHVLKTVSLKLRRALILHAGDELIKALTECVINTLNGNHKMSHKVKKHLSTHKTYLRKLNNPKVGPKGKRKVLAQKGGFLIPLLTSILSGVIGNLINS